jgi:hypothetical protein
MRKTTGHRKSGEPRGTATRILDAAESVFAEQGYGAASTREMARRAHVEKKRAGRSAYSRPCTKAGDAGPGGRVEVEAMIGFSFLHHPGVWSTGQIRMRRELIRLR